MSPESIVIIVSQLIQSLGILVSIKLIKSRCTSEVDIEKDISRSVRETPERINLAEVDMFQVEPDCVESASPSRGRKMYSPPESAPKRSVGQLNREGGV